MKAKTLVIIGILAALLVACGPSTPEVEKMVATAVAESEERLTAEWQAKATEALSVALAGSEERMNAAILKSEDGLVEALDAILSVTVKAVCWSDYRTVTAYTMAYWVVDHLQGGEPTLEELSLIIDEGMPINEDYAGYSKVCGVDDDGWVFLDMPDPSVDE